MIRQSVVSSDIASIGYDGGAQVLEVQFHSGGIYDYSGVPFEIYDAFMSASSHGKYFHAYIKDRYPHSKIF